MTGKSNTGEKLYGKRIFVILSVIGFIICAIIATGLFYWNANKKSIIKNELQKVISKNAGFYNVSYDSLNIDEGSGSLYVQNMKLVVDSNRFQAVEQKGDAPPLIFTISIPEMAVTGVNAQKALMESEIIGRKLVIRNPVVNIQYTYKGKDSIRNLPTREVYEQVLGNLNMVQVDSIKIESAVINTFHRVNGRTIVHAENLDLCLADVRIDSAAYTDPKRFLFAKSITVDVGKASWPSPDGLYNFHAENISMNTVDQKLVIDAFSVDPTLGEIAFVNKMPTQDDRFDFTFKKIVLEDIKVDRLLEEYLEASSMKIGTANLKIYRDLAKPRDHKNRIGDYPHQEMQQLPFLFNIGRVNLYNSYVEYKERNHITRESGKVKFYNTNATITNFTNDKKLVSPGEAMNVFVNASFLNRTPIKTKWTFYLFHPKGKFNVSGSIGAISGEALNALAEPMGPASIREGKMDGMTFNMVGNDNGMSGSVKFLYQDLKVDLLEKDKGATETDKKFLMSLLANIVIKNSNPKRNDETRVARVSMNRDPNRSLFYLCWKTIFKGIRETVGVKDKSPA